MPPAPRRVGLPLELGGGLDRIELHRLALDLVHPLVAAHGTETDRRTILVAAVGADGLVGWGECPALLAPTYTSEWHDGAWVVLSELLVPATLAGRDAGVTGHPMAAAGIEGALIDLALRRERRSLASALGVERDRVPVCAVVASGGGIDEVVEAVSARVEAGHRVVKVKVRPGQAADTVAALRSCWADLDLAVDANGSFSRVGRDGLDELVRLDGFELLYLEQPLAADDLVGAAELASRLATPIALDESLVSLGVVETALALGALGAANLKPARLGGIRPTLAIHDRLAGEGVGIFCGGMFESSLGRSVALALGALSGGGLPSDLSPASEYLREDPVEGLGPLGPDGTVAVPDGHGVGVGPDLGRLAEHRVEHRVLDS